jgi:hypothetical protein
VDSEIEIRLCLIEETSTLSNKSIC